MHNAFELVADNASIKQAFAPHEHREPDELTTDETEVARIVRHKATGHHWAIIIARLEPPESMLSMAAMLGMPTPPALRASIVAACTEDGTIPFWATPLMQGQGVADAPNASVEGILNEAFENLAAFHAMRKQDVPDTVEALLGQ